MKKLSLLLIALAIISCKETKKETTEEKVETKTETVALTDGNYAVKVDNSNLNWKGSKPTGSHNGTVAVKEGNFIINNNKVVGGNVVFDMATIINLDMPADDKMNAKLVGHLKSPDFFDVANNPTSMFEITGSDTEEGTTILKGNLTIKGITKAMEVPVSITQAEDGISLNSDSFTFDRTDFDIKFKSNKFFDDLKDKFIDDEVEISFELKG